MIVPDLQIVIHNCIKLHNSLDKLYGPEATAMWINIANAMPDEVKNEVLMAMLRGSNGNHVIFTCEDSIGRTISVIKIIRNYTGCGLFEAKEMWDTAVNGSPLEIICTSPEKAQQLRKELQANRATIL